MVSLQVIILINILKIFLDNNIDYELFLDGIETEFAWQQLIIDFIS